MFYNCSPFGEGDKLLDISVESYIPAHKYWGYSLSIYTYLSLSRCTLLSPRGTLFTCTFFLLCTFFPDLQDDEKARNRLSKFTYTGNAADTLASEEILITTDPKMSTIHTSGWIGFKPSAKDLNVSTNCYISQEFGLCYFSLTVRTSFCSLRWFLLCLCFLFIVLSMRMFLVMSLFLILGCFLPCVCFS